MININELDEQKFFRLNAWIILISYIGLYSLFLIITRFLPYVFDNNETFSSLIHAQNLYNFGVKESFGITDEAYGFFKSSHPFVYTHQGNFPRFYTFILYYLGAKSPELQIIITTFTIGLAGIWFCYYYLAKAVSPLLAAIFCLLLMTDYIMFAQWQVNIWRVWHLFFFFLSFLCCHGLIGKYRKFFIILTIINFSCLFYLELSFATFVFLSSAIYLLLIKKNWKQLIWNSLFLGIGAAIGVGILIAQDIAFLGWSNFLTDLSYTFSARNHLANNANEIKKVISFYATNKIVFWENFNAITNIRNFVLLIANFYRHCLLPYPQLLTIASLIMMSSTVITYLQNSVFKSSTRLIFSTKKAEQFIKYSVFFSSLICFIILLRALFPLSLGLSGIIINLTKPFSILSVSILTLYLISQVNKININLHPKLTSKNYIFLISFLLLSALLLFVIFYLNKKLQIPSLKTLQEFTLSISGGTATLPLIAAAILFIAALPLIDKSYSLTQKRFKAFLPFLIATLIGFIGAYLIFPGYIISAYWVRSCCFTIFAHMALYAWTFYFIALQIIGLIQPKAHLNIKEVKSLSTLKVFKLITAIFLFMLFTYTWIFTQYAYIKEFPGDNFNFLNLLKKQPFIGSPIVASTYAAPFSYTTQNWGYFDPLMGSMLPSKDNKLRHDFRYLWFADANENTVYHHPKFFICWQQVNFEQLGSDKSKCGNIELVKFARNNRSKLKFIELEHDLSGRDQWSIVSLSGSYQKNSYFKHALIKIWLGQYDLIDIMQRHFNSHENYKNEI